MQHIETTRDYLLEEALKEIHANITSYTTLGEITFSNIHLLAQYFIQQNLGPPLYEELKSQLGYTHDQNI